MRCAGGGDETLRQQPVELVRGCRRWHRPGRGRLTRQCDLHLMRGGEHLLDAADDVEHRRRQRLGHPLPQHANSGRVHTGAGATPQPRRPRSRRGGRATSRRICSRPRRVRGFTGSSMVLTGDGTDTATGDGFRAPSRRLARPSSRTPAHPPRSPRRRDPEAARGGWPPATDLRGACSTLRSSGGARPASFQPVGDRFRNGLPPGSGELLLQRLGSLPRPTLVSVRGLHGERHRRR